MTRWFGPLQRSIRRRLSRGIVVLLYHRVAEPGLDPLLLSVSPDNFGQQLEVLKSRGPVLPLAEIVRRLRSGRSVPARSAAITFDDGYADNLTVAHPLVTKAGFHATYFLTSGMIGSERGFWWDELAWLLLAPVTTRWRAQIEIQGRLLSWDIEASEGLLPASDRWSILSRSDDTSAEKAFRTLFVSMRSLGSDRREEILAELSEQRAPSRGPGHDQKVLSVREARVLAGDAYADIGAHTVTHPVLSSLSPTSEYEEITRSKRGLEELLDTAVDSFAYPYGSRLDYSRRTIASVRKAGFMFACSNFERPIRRSQDLLQIPRFLVRDWDGDRFGSELNAAFI